MSTIQDPAASNIFRKIQTRGFRWLLKRIIQEIRLPEKTLGKKIKPFTMALYRIITFPIQLFTIYPVKDTLYLFYDLETSPITYDLCWVICLAEQSRRKLNLKHLQVVIVPAPTPSGLRKEMPDYEVVVDEASRKWRIQNLLSAIPSLLPSTAGIIHFNTRKEADWFRKKIAPHKYIYPKDYTTFLPTYTPAHTLGEYKTHDLMALRATEQSLRYMEEWLKTHTGTRKPIVITLREYHYMPARNSNVQAWANFAQQLDANQYAVIIVPDTEKAALKPAPELEHFILCYEACWNIELRMALYELAYLNLGINNGPFALCWLNAKCKYIMFKILTEGVPQTSVEALIAYGFEPYTNPRFANKYQKWVWADDSEEIIAQEFNKMKATFINESLI